MKNFIVVAGNIGAGKSTLVELLSNHFNWKPYFEPVTENPYLADFYGDMAKWAYRSQMYFLSDRLAMHKDLQDYQGSVVQDRSVYEDASIFAMNLFKGGYIDERDFSTYWKLYELIADMLNPPDVMVYLKASVDTLVAQIGKRNRDFESDIPRQYLEQLNVLYDEWIGSWTRSPVLTIDMDSTDFTSSPEDLSGIIRDIERLVGDRQGELF